MVYSKEDFNQALGLVRKRISNILITTEMNSDEITLRSDIKTFAEASQFVETYESVIHSRFRSLLNRSAPGRKWICIHKRMDQELAKMSPKCPATINITVRKVTKYSKLKDAFLKRDPPLPAVIKIDPNHNHPLTDSACLLKYVKISSPVKECFYEYFKRGIYGAKAKLFHEQNLQKANFHALEDVSMNPSLDSIYGLQRHWKKLEENVQLHKASTANVSTSVQIVHIPTVAVTQFSSDNSFMNNNVVCKYEVDSGENTNFDEIPSEVLQSFEHDEDVKPIFNIKKEIEDDDNVGNDGLPIIESYGSLATPFITDSASVVKVSPPNTQLVVFDKSSNTFKVIQYLSVGSKYNCSDHTSSQYNSYLPRTLLPPRVVFHRI